MFHIISLASIHVLSVSLNVAHYRSRLSLLFELYTVMACYYVSDARQELLVDGTVRAGGPKTSDHSLRFPQTISIRDTMFCLIMQCMLDSDR